MHELPKDLSAQLLVVVNQWHNGEITDQELAQRFAEIGQTWVWKYCHDNR